MEKGDEQENRGKVNVCLFNKICTSLATVK